MSCACVCPSHLPLWKSSPALKGNSILHIAQTPNLSSLTFAFIYTPQNSVKLPSDNISSIQPPVLMPTFCSLVAATVIFACGVGSYLCSPSVCFIWQLEGALKVNWSDCLSLPWTLHWLPPSRREAFLPWILTMTYAALSDLTYCNSSPSSALIILPMALSLTWWALPLLGSLYFYKILSTSSALAQTLLIPTLASGLDLNGASQWDPFFYSNCSQPSHKHFLLSFALFFSLYQFAKRVYPLIYVFFFFWFPRAEY